MKPIFHIFGASARRQILRRIANGDHARPWLGFHERFWTDRLNALERLLRKEATSKSTTPLSTKREDR